VSTSGSGTILVVDDEPVILELVGRILGRVGYRVLKARDEKQALEQGAVPDLQVDAVVLDLSVFHGGLPAALERLGNALGPVGMVVVSGAPLAAGERALLEQKHHRYLSKPFAPGELVEAVQSVIQA
jgi:CheY-like chemotaxis protein